MEQGRMLPTKWLLLQMATLFSLDEHSLFAAHHIELIKKGKGQGRPVSPQLELLTIRNFPVAEPLSSFVESIIYYNNPHQSYIAEIVMPDGMPMLVIDLHRSSALLIGQRDTPMSLSLDKDIRKIIIRFHPDGLYRLSGIAQSDLLNEILDAEHIFGKPIRTLCREMTGQADPDKLRRCIVKGLTFLLPDNDKDMLSGEVIRYMLRHIAEPIAALTRQTGYSQKHLAHLFRVHVGLTPKVFQQVIKFKTAINDLSLLPTQQLSGYNWSGNYFDQAHFTRQFTRFSGFTPVDYLRTGNTCPRMVLIRR
ncbi:MAG TPA: AraC family transcriptional regulator [Puia sp.]|uniref:helix-turn-helix domain-containing protein n=1 Tax=Puia sp. TaxID=2045100 RepID=UPI002C07CFA5|nr:AraC family transcriptional regulator [Puia sp.]HVU98746.1 AraC family transcriptional regulator [Puia sp.]